MIYITCIKYPLSSLTSRNISYQCLDFIQFKVAIFKVTIASLEAPYLCHKTTSVCRSQIVHQGFLEIAGVVSCVSFLHLLPYSYKMTKNISNSIICCKTNIFLWEGPPQRYDLVVDVSQQRMIYTPMSSSRICYLFNMQFSCPKEWKCVLNINLYGSSYIV